METWLTLRETIKTRRANPNAARTKKILYSGIHFRVSSATLIRSPIDSEKLLPGQVNGSSGPRRFKRDAKRLVSSERRVARGTSIGNMKFSEKSDRRCV